MKISKKQTGRVKLNNKESGPETDELSVNAKGGTEMMKEALYEKLDPETRDHFQIIPSRVRNIDEDKPSILWCHDTWNDPESKQLSNQDFRDQFVQLVFVSNHQFNTYNMGLGVPFSGSVVIPNAIEPIPAHTKPTDGVINLIYHTTPHRGLEILVPVFEKLYEKLGERIHLDVFSSFEIYGWPSRDATYKETFDVCKEHKGITYHGFQPNDVVRKALEKAHIFAYPSIWPETSCIAAIEAMSAGCMVVCPNLAALPETCSNFAQMYFWHEDHQTHANIFAQVLYNSIEHITNPGIQEKLKFQKMYFDAFYPWDLRIEQWKGLLHGLKKINKT